MGFRDRNDPLKISHKFGYVPLRDPREDPVEIFDVIPSAPSKAGLEFFQKYLVIVRTRLPRDLVSQWVITLSAELKSFLHLTEDESQSEDFLGFMVQGFAMAACEDSYFEIAKTNQMSECAWEAMRYMAMMQAMEGADFKDQSCLNALLAGYFLAKMHKGKQI
jgi:hypothetical protein